MDLTSYLTFTLACIAVIIVPGPTVTVIIANSLRHGTRAGLANVAGTQIGMLLMLGVLAAGLQTIVETMAHVFDWLRLAGAAYLVWLGYKLLRSDGTLGTASQRTRPGGSFFWQGILVICSNPKALFFLGAFLPQFIDPAGNALHQTILLGATFMVVGAVLDGGYAVLAGRTGGILTRNNVRKVEVASGCFLISGGIWLALARRI